MLTYSRRLAYNLSPSFNWKTAMEPKDQETYIKRLATLGYCWQFITLAGLHSTALISSAFSKDYAKRGIDLHYGWESTQDESHIPEEFPIYSVSPD